MILFVSLFVSFVITTAIDQCDHDGSLEFYQEIQSVKYCFKVILSGTYNFKDSDNQCKAWKDGARMMSVHHDDEWNYLYNTILAVRPSQSHWAGIVKTGFHTNCEIDANIKWMDSSDKTWLYANNRLYTGAANRKLYSTNCNGGESFCFRQQRDSQEASWRDDKCTSSSHNVVCKYKFKKCGAYWADDVDVCNQHGSCVEDDTCDCEFGYTGSLCESTHWCYTYRQDQVGVCGGNGNCTATDSCSCEDGYFGDECEFTVGSVSDCMGSGESIFRSNCYKKYGGNGDFGMNVWDAIDNCTAWGGNLVSIEDYTEETFLRGEFDYFLTGLMKNPLNLDYGAESMYPCTSLSQGYLYLDYSTPDTYPVAKGNRIKCTGLDLCFAVDDDFYWNERPCDEEDANLGHVCKRRIGLCSGVSATDEDQCRRRGYCDADSGSCVCYNGYMGNDCGTWECFGVLHDFKSILKSPCSGHGDCVGPNNCVCEENYGGVDCSSTFCDGIISTRSDVCNGNGNCTEFNVCECDDQYGGDYCLTPYPTSDNVDTDKGGLQHITFGTNTDCADPSDGGSYNTYYSCDIPEWEYQYLSNPEKKRVWMFQHESNNWGDDTNGLSSYDAEEYAKNDWYPGKGLLVPITHQKVRDWVRARRWMNTNNDRTRDVWTAVRKRFNIVAPPYDICGDSSFECFYNAPFEECDDPMNTPYLTSPGINYNLAGGGCQSNGASDEYYICCNTPSKCDRQRRPSKFLDDIECEVPINWVAIYELHFCKDIREDDTANVCSGNGFCWEDDVCTCKGSFGYIEPWCETRWCHGIESNHKEVCSGNGNCVEIVGEPYHGQCECSEKWYGSNCNITECNGILTNDTSSEGEGGLVTKVCNGHGVCYFPDTCFCGTIDEDGTLDASDVYFGDECEKTYCNDIGSDSEMVCSEHGECIAYDTCSCNSTEEAVYTGEFCEVYYCYDVESTDYENVCNGGGDCVDIDVCKCIFGEYWGEKCEVTMCYGYFSNDTENVCSGKGECNSFGVCTCNDTYSFDDCSIPSCFGIVGDDTENVCSGNGDCKGFNDCNCTNPDFVGDDCSLTMCYDVRSDLLDEVCWGGKGECVSKDKCECNEFLHGVECSGFICDGEYDNQTDSVCSTRGNCTGPNVCTCEEGYDPASFCEFFMCYGVSSEDVDEVCGGGKGECIGIDNCDCNYDTSNNYYGTECYEYINDDEEEEAELYFDFLSQRRLVRLPYQNLDPEYVIDVDKVSCFEDGILESIKFEGTEDNNLFGTGPKCYFSSNYMIIEISDDDDDDKKRREIDLLEMGEYKIEFILQTVPTVGNLTYVYELVLDEDEKDYADDDDYDFTIEDNNDQPEEIEDEDEDDEEEEEEEEEEEDEDDEDGGSNSNVAIAISTSSVVAVLLILMLLVLLCCCLCLCVLFCGCCCLFCCVRFGIKKLKGGGYGGEPEQLNFNWKVGKEMKDV